MASTPCTTPPHSRQVMNNTQRSNSPPNPGCDGSSGLTHRKAFIAPGYCFEQPPPLLSPRSPFTFSMIVRQYLVLHRNLMLVLFYRKFNSEVHVTLSYLITSRAKRCRKHVMQD
ncbi:hypothetical protein E2C01_050486 [Portunus trituberculatus]|uniref:Uncharacterized protein n=1 Tax=Portunus trituberculatus TaxID=210409 RepID=A0A5B7GJ40_PORTR|nr:hypothetical protein [Portunus trituberculatus]